MSDGLDIDLRQPVGDDPEGNPVVNFIKGWGPPLLAVLIIRSIIIEPFQIPSGSMVPTLAIGDFIVVSKFAYGLRVPFTDIELVPLGEPERGDVDVFIYPPSVSDDPWCKVKRIPKDWTLDLLPFLPGPEQPCSIDYVKRLVGLPGDTVEVRDDVVYINGEAQTRVEVGDYDYVDVRGCSPQPMKQYTETLGSVPHTTLQTTMFGMRTGNYGPAVVPEGHYFFMGDNRDNSRDSRYDGVGFIPEANVVGRAVRIWMSWSFPGLPKWGRIGTEVR